MTAKLKCEASVYGGTMFLSLVLPGKNKQQTQCPLLYPAYGQERLGPFGVYEKMVEDIVLWCEVGVDEAWDILLRSLPPVLIPTPKSY